MRRFADHSTNPAAEEEAFMFPSAGADPIYHSSQAVPDVLTSNDDLNEELQASLARLTRMYTEEGMDTAQPRRFPEFDLAQRNHRVADIHGNVLEDDEEDVYKHYLNMDQTKLGLPSRSSGYTVLVPSVHDDHHPQQYRSSTRKSTSKKKPISTPQRAVRSFASAENKATSPLAQGARRVVPAKSRPSTASSQPKKATRKKITTTNAQQSSSNQARKTPRKKT